MTDKTNDKKEPKKFEMPQSVLTCQCIKERHSGVSRIIYEAPEAATMTMALYLQSYNMCPIAMTHYFARMLATSILATHSANKILDRKSDQKAMETEAVALVENAFHALEAEIIEIGSPLTGEIKLHPYRKGGRGN